MAVVTLEASRKPCGLQKWEKHVLSIAQLAALARSLSAVETGRADGRVASSYTCINVARQGVVRQAPFRDEAVDKKMALVLKAHNLPYLLCHGGHKGDQK